MSMNRRDFLKAGSLVFTPGVNTGWAFALNAKGFRVSDFGAIGDGVHDDGPAITVAFAAAK
jgi:polygalacturonase